MKERDHKENIIADLIAMGYSVEQDQVRKVINEFTILIHLSTQARVLIETKGTGIYWFVLKETKRVSYSKTSANELADAFESLIRKCEAFKETN